MTQSLKIRRTEGFEACVGWSGKLGPVQGLVVHLVSIAAFYPRLSMQIYLPRVSPQIVIF